MKTTLTIDDTAWEIEHEGHCELPGTYILMETQGTMLDSDGKELEAIGALSPPVITCSFCGAEGVKTRVNKVRKPKTSQLAMI